MSLFCPTCHNILSLDDSTRSMSMVCSTCPYILPIKEEVKKTKLLRTIELEDKYKWDEINKKSDKVKLLCPECKNNVCVISELKLLAESKTSTNFYQCMNCYYSWTVN